MPPTLDLIAACAFGLESVVRRELQDLGIEATIGQSGRVHFQGDLKTVALANLQLRCADRVLIRVAEFPAPDFDALFESVRAIDWGSWLPRDAEFPVTGRSIQSVLSSVPACQRSVKRAIVDAMQRDHGCETLEETGPKYKIDIALLKDVATLTIDTTGRSLHRRGYRTDISKAPLKETLAAALVLLSFWKRDRPLMDPFCGSGTIAIEAARIGRNIAPGIERAFRFESWPDCSAELIADLRSDATAGQLDSLDERILASDIDGRVLRAARDNAARADVSDDIHFQCGPVSEVTSKRRFGCLITNPPYGRRIGEDREIDALYRSLPDVLRRFPTWSHYFLTAYPKFEAAVGRSADRRRKLYNGRIECTYYQFHGPKRIVQQREPAETTADAAPVKPYTHADGPAAFGELDAKASEQAELFARRLSKRAKHLRRWPTRRGITCFRLYERDIPEIPLVVDRYEDHLHITEYERPHERDPAQHANWLDLMARTAAETLEVAPNHVHFKRRFRQRDHGQHEKVDQTGNRMLVNEGGLKFWVNLDDYVDTGLFLDHRITRSMVREAAQGTWFLNLFAYTGTFTAYATDGGARKTTSVDLSNTYLSWAKENLRVNGFLDEKRQDGHQFVASDVAEFIDQHPAGERYDLVVFDPPTYSRSKKTEQDWNVQTDALPLLAKLLPLVRKGGVIFFSTNFRRFKFDADALEVTECHEISRQTVPEDFRNRRIHRCWRIVK
ncbi:bifunctional 23S rRNA (guanine(2069)-N(7))-methyltransferase RlmK/23S rRNA (guanine(2445)-N(2))-methyltransferase RlmL [Roseiconus nitratireducens]|uniref:Bifunctional 23S rRNA (Guanine(2069)-N(7))-methyltransferase RlmK/23S rRNA (Guanine(2445)-N(2))-methyltransferase RlmL n=1 Tax=Roseiconus nitratireducens TaxID=2605748 RepID=A0A5M6D2Z7_9BACT|nr:bifunctional 23S rRNA (guanine(2069)-N(7))-methyltransferase RlmK/23S rRNA (guanine(2445)-N(2))-methyltransferase RlmL [Roseiconus nitratireducens]KAA5541874.1 bifunctional 23S rRNA (guanine(2069)-N(7))-methyltransferase RlmK/23S rRNA (guanine(2445)-N(2))-methyltransferase RlmL [Roseiconus nitratireducens]